MRAGLFILSLIGLSSGCGDCWSDERPGSCEPPDVSHYDCDIATSAAYDATSAAYDALSTYCYGCHGKGGSIEGGMNFVLEADVLTAREIVVPESPDASLLYQRLSSGSMPPPGSPAPSDAEIAAVKAWIECGAEALYEREAREFLGFDYAFGQASNDLSTLPEPERPFVRYVSLVHLYDAGVSDIMLDTYRVGLAKLVNSLSWEAEVRNPVVVDALGLVFRVDVRDYRWQADSTEPVEAWEYIVASNPYAFDHSAAYPDFAALRSGTRSRLPVVQGDWLVKAASVAPVYNFVLEIPETQAEWLAQFGVDQEANVESFNVLRAGTLSSGVSDFNRVIERHPANYGYCWVSYDFGNENDQKNICAHPLDFDEDGGEMICQLPNGLQSYYLADAVGGRLDIGPTNVVADPNRGQQGEKYEVVNGISCMNCHYDGIIVKTDDVRDCASYSADDYNSIKDELEQIYAETDALSAAMSEDQGAFLASMAQTRVPRVVENLESDLAGEFQVEGEPTFALSREFDRDLDLARVAAELGVEPADLNVYSLESLDNDELKQLLYEGGTISRSTFLDLVVELLCLIETPGEFDAATQTCTPEVVDACCGELAVGCLDGQECALVAFQPKDPNVEGEAAIELAVCVEAGRATEVNGGFCDVNDGTGDDTGI